MSNLPQCRPFSLCIYDAWATRLLCCSKQCENHRRRKRGQGEGEGHVPPKIREKYFSGNYYVKFGHFSSKNHVKFGNFVNFSGKYHKNAGILIIFLAGIK